jgi:pimeloyl-ACP methyl ester carboxylesterase
VEPLSNLQAELASSGYTVAVLDIGDGTGDLNEYGRDAVARADELLADGASSVSSVGFSAGGLIGRIAAVAQPDLFQDVISLASPHEGTLWAVLGGANCPTACQLMKPNSPLLESLPDAPDPEAWLSVYSTTDEVVVPATSSDLPGATVLVIQDLEPGATVRHGQVPSDPTVLAAVKAFLADEPVGADNQ